MVRWFLFCFLLPLAVLFIPQSARAELRILKLPILPSIRASASARLSSLERIPEAAKSRAGGLVGSITRTLEERRGTVPWRLQEGGPRNPTVRDAARDRDSTSLGVRGARLSQSGLAMAGIGLAAGAAKTLGKFGKGLDLTISPTLVLGGGGLSLNGKW